MLNNERGGAGIDHIVTIGIPVYNEENNLGRLTESILNQRDVNFTEIIFVLSGCQDRSREILEDYIGKDGRISLVTQEKRQGKASAINILLQKAKGEIVVISSADVILESGCLSRLLAPFNDPKVGMSGAHPLPMGSSDTIAGRLNKIIWGLHHLLSLRSPKLGETVAVRHIFDSIPFDCVTDEVYMEYLIKSRGYELCYKEDALVHNRCPLNLRDLFLQRRRLFWGHIEIKNKFGYTAASMRAGRLLAALASYMARNPSDILPLFLLCAVELSARTSAAWRYYVTKKPVSFIWPNYNK